jgi:PAS domain S-box-containing protein
MPDDAPPTDGLTPLDIARQAELLELTQDAILVRDYPGSIISYWNRGAERLYGYSRAEAYGRVSHSLLDTRFPSDLADVDAALSRDGFWQGELTHIRKDGSPVVVASRQAVQRDAAGQPIAILEINTDITAGVAAEAERLRLASEQRAREIAERALDHLFRLQQITARLAEALTPNQVAEVVVEQSIAALGARSGRVSLLRPDGVSVDVLATSGYDWVRSPVGLDEPLPTTSVIRSGSPLFGGCFIDLVEQFPGIGSAVGPVVPGALASVPLRAEGRVTGAITIIFEGDRDFQDDDRELLIAMAAQCSQALERARLYELSLSIQEDLRSSRDQLGTILANIAEGVTVQDASGNLIYANTVAANLCGFDSPEDLVANAREMPARFEVFDESGHPISFAELPGRRLINDASQRYGEILLQYRDRDTRERRWTILDATSVRDDADRLQLVVSIFRDITERKRQTDASELLAAAGSVLAATLDVQVGLQQFVDLAVPSFADWAIVDLLDGERRIRRIALSHDNPADDALAAAVRGNTDTVAARGGIIEQVLRNGRGELIVNWGADEPRFVLEDTSRQSVVDRMQIQSWIVVPLVARRQTFGALTFATARSGRRFSHADFELAGDLAARAALALDNARLYSDAQEQAQHQSTLNVALRETIDERDNAVAELRQALRTRDEFLASASHDLKNPLASVKATAQLLQRRLDRPGPLDNDRLREGLTRIDQISTRAAGVVDELLDLARMQMGAPLDLDRQRSSLIAMARGVVGEQQSSERHPIELSVEAEPDALDGIWDVRRLGRVLTNLLDNAIKYTPDGGPISVRLRRDGDWAVLEVTDQGIGVPAADQARIFERFQRASNVAGRIGGTGIGLASARHIVESHGGTIVLASREGRGATFSVRLPVDGGAQDGVAPVGGT